jgi:hypothetical protein
MITKSNLYVLSLIVYFIEANKQTMIFNCFTLEVTQSMKKVISNPAYLAIYGFKTGKKSSNREFNGPKGVQTDIGAKNGF